MGHVLAESEPTHKGFLQFAEKVKTRTNGQVEIQVFPNAQLGSDLDATEQARLGAPVIANTTFGYLGQWVPDFEVFGGPYFLQNVAQVDKVVNSDFFKGLEKRLVDQRGIRMLSFNWFFADRHFVTTKKAIATPADLNGQKIRIANSPMWAETIRALGGSPVPLDWAEVYTSLQQGVVDGAESPLASIYGSKLYEVAKNVSLSGHLNQVNGPVIGEKFYQTLSPDVQKILNEEALAAGKYMTQLSLDQQGELKKKLEDQGVKLTNPDRDAFAKAAEAVYPKINSKWTPGLFEQAKKIRDN
jgi:tripartite ATP-independent transporter DctP family solute receptor